METIIPGVQASIVFQCLLFIAYLINDGKFVSLSNRINLTLMTTLAIHMLFNLINQHVAPNALPNLVFGFGLFYGPLIYMYVKSLIYKDLNWPLGTNLHFLPAVVLSVWALVFHVSGVIGAILTFASMGGYLLLSLWHYWFFRRVLGQTQSAEDLITMNWISIVLILNAMAIIVNIISVYLTLVKGVSTYATLSELSLFLVLLILVNTFLFKGLTQPKLFAGISEEDGSIVKKSRKKFTGGELTQEQHERIQKKLIEHMSNNRPYLDPMFSLQTLGRQLGETPRYVSLVINQNLQQTFADFVNTYRLNEVKCYMSDAEDNRTIIDIIYDCGFSTKSNFNRAFKKHEGMTPSEFRQGRRTLK
jgi:AraC-like DNA-binding protein